MEYGALAKMRRSEPPESREVTRTGWFVYTMYLQGAARREDATRKMGQ